MSPREALEQVALLRARMLESQKFRGYSGRARALGGCVALIGALAMRRFDDPGAGAVFLTGWGAVFVVAFLINFAAVLDTWRRMSPAARRTSSLAPALESLPILAAGGLVTARLALDGQLGALPGIWCVIFALTQFTAKYAVPRGLRRVGAAYLAAGAALLAAPESARAEPLLPGLVFFFGEWAGGWVIFRAHHRGTVLDFLSGKTFSESSAP